MSTLQATDQSVRIDIGQRSVMNPRKAPQVVLMDVFSAPGPDGETMLFRFKDEAGQAFPPRLPFHLPRSHKFFENNLSAFQAYKKYYRPSIEIYDPVKVKKEELDSDELELTARNLIAEYRKEEKWDTLVDMLRRLEGSVGDITQSDLLIRLNRIAKAEPSRIMALPKDADLETKILIDKAVELNRKNAQKGIVLQDGRFYKFTDGRIIADGIEEMVHKVKTDAGLKSFLTGSALPARVLPVEAPSVLDTLDINKAAEIIPAGATENLSGEVISEDRIRQVVQQAINGNYYEQDGQGNFLLPQGKTPFKNVDEATAFYKANPDWVGALEKELAAFGI